MWFRRDLRLDDNPALHEAARAGSGRVVPLFVLDPKVYGPVGPNRRSFLAGTLAALDRELGGTLVVRRGSPATVVPAVAREVGASTVVVTRGSGPYGARRDTWVGEALAGDGLQLVVAGSPYLVTPGTLRTSTGGGFGVFSAFLRALERAGWPAPLPEPDARYEGAPSDARAEDLLAGVASPGSAGLPEWWQGLPLGPAARLPEPGPRAARSALERFVRAGLDSYAERRDDLGVEGTSRLSAYLHFGCLHPRTVLARAGTGRGADRLRSELAWRDFYADVLWHRPQSAREPLQAFGRHLRWDEDGTARERFIAWATARTGYDLVDAAMRQLLEEGWAHNRARMVAASFLVKDLHIDWRLGARWYMWHLVDGDLASNQHGWQWVAGTGTDAAPFHRIFNPELQRQRFDPTGSYVARYLGPEREHRSGGPGDAQTAPLPGLAVAQASPRPRLVDHAHERAEALARFAAARERARLSDR